jgi:pimeloyl-ACP methyl ester carboxylesterase
VVTQSVWWDTLDVDVPEIEYTRSGDVAIAYQTFGDGPRDLVLVPMFSNLVFPWLNSDWRGMYHRFASFSRLIMFDKRGTGLSDRPRDLGPLETRMDDIRAVLDAVGTERATLVGMGEGGQTCALFEATYPERTETLVLVNTPARAVSAEDYPYGTHEDEWRAQLRTIRERWGAREYFEARRRQARGRVPSGTGVSAEPVRACELLKETTRPSRLAIRSRIQAES